MFDHDKINFEVEKFNLFAYDPDPATIGAVPSNIGMGIRRKDTKEPLGIVSQDYFPVQYREIVDGVEQALRKAELDLTGAEFTTNTWDRGGKLELRAKFPAHTQSLGTNHDTIIPEFVFRTSHNRTWANSGMMGMWRTFCYNTLVTGDKLAHVYGRHTKNFDVSAFASKIKNAGEFISGSGLDTMKDWYDTKVTREEAINLFTRTLAQRTDNVTRKKVANKTMLSNLMKIFDEENRHLHGRGKYEAYGTREEGTLWSAYNSATHWSSHPENSKGKTHNVKIGREDKVRKMLASPEWKELEVA